MLPDAPQLQCAACDNESSGYYFGAVVCLDCASFFELTILRNRVYFCQTKHCDFVEANDETCRFCRFVKCCYAGMLPTAVKKRHNAFSLIQAYHPPDAFYREIQELLEMSYELQLERARGFFQHCDITWFRFGMHYNFQLFKSMSNKYILLNGIMFNDRAQQISASNWTHLLSGTIERDMFLKFVFLETCFSTFRYGGCPLERTIFADKSYIDVDEYSIQYFFGNTVPLTEELFHTTKIYLMNVSTIVAQALQEINFGDAEIGAVYYIILASNVNSQYQYPVVEQRRVRLIDELTRSGPDQSVFGAPNDFDRRRSISRFLDHFHEAYQTFLDLIDCFHRAYIALDDSN